MVRVGSATHIILVDTIMDEYNSIIGYECITREGETQFYTADEFERNKDLVIEKSESRYIDSRIERHFKNDGEFETCLFRVMYHKIRENDGRIGRIAFNRVKTEIRTKMYVLYRNLAFYNFPCINFYHVYGERYLGDSEVIRAKLRLGYDRSRDMSLALVQCPGIQSVLAIGNIGDIQNFLGKFIANGIVETDRFKKIDGTGELEQIYALDELAIYATNKYKSRAFSIAQSSPLAPQIDENYNLDTLRLA